MGFFYPEYNWEKNIVVGAKLIFILKTDESIYDGFYIPQIIKIIYTEIKLDINNFIYFDGLDANLRF